ncbi:MAG: hypothetical protein LBI28_15040, partial [Treponema sp.]|nr:hypothetical protein [Treponema sp.]
MGIKSTLLAFSAIAHAYSIVLSTKYDGNKVLKNEKNVKLFLENIIRNHNDYSMKAFDRKAISYKVLKTAVTTHSFYVICSADGIYHTLNFSATGKGAISKGAWAMDTGSDISSYIDYLNGNNRWEVREIMTKNGINTLLTIRNVLSKMRSGVKYHFLSKTDKNDNFDNCTTALLETLVENEFNIIKFKSDRTTP